MDPNAGTTLDTVFVADTQGAWRTLANPNGGAPLIDYRGNASDGRETRPHGITLDAMTQADHVAFQLAEVIASGKTLDEAKAPLQAFTTLVAPAGVAVENLTDDDRKFVAETNAKNKAIGDAALAVLATGQWQGTPTATEQPATSGAPRGSTAQGGSGGDASEIKQAVAAAASDVEPRTIKLTEDDRSPIGMKFDVEHTDGARVAAVVVPHGPIAELAQLVGEIRQYVGAGAHHLVSRAEELAAEIRAHL